jgi:hypothetical protein
MLTGENLKVLFAEFSTLGQGVFVMSVILWHRQTRPHLELKARLRFRTASDRKRQSVDFYPSLIFVGELWSRTSTLDHTF